MNARRLVAVAMASVTAVAVAGVATTIVIARAGGTPNVTTAGYNNLRDNWDPNEPGLSPSVVQSAGFGRLFSTAVAGSVYAQPLVVNGTVIVTTEKAKAYGIDAATGAVDWTRSFGKPFESATIGCSDLTPDLGSTSTPVVDPSTGTVYLTTRLETGGRGLAHAHWFLQALSASTGAEVSGYPVELTGTPYNTPNVPFNDAYALQRPGLLLLGGTVYMAFASDCDFNPYRGIVIGVATASHAITTMWSDESGIGTDRNSQAGVWQSGAGLVSDQAKRIIMTSGNGVSPQPAPSNQPPPTLSESIIGLTVGANGKIAPTQFFAPSDAANLDANDQDFGSGGPIGLPTKYFGTSAHVHLVVQVGKDGRIFLVDTDDMGGFQQGPGGSDAVLQTVGPFGGVWGHPAAYGGQGGWIYVLESGGGVLRALSYGVNGDGTPQLTAVGTSNSSFGYTSGSPLVTSNGTKAGSAVVWAVHTNGSAGTNANLLAYGAIPSGGVLPLLWSAPIGTASKFSSPTAWNGRVYIGTRDGHLLAFGASGSAALQAAAVAFGSVPVGTSHTVTLAASTPEGLTLTGPVTASGYEGVPAPAPAAAASNGATPSASTTTTTTATRPGVRVTTSTLPGATAGPSVPPPSLSAPIAATVFSVAQPAVGTKFAAGATISLRVTFTPTHAGPVVAALSIPTSAGTQTVALSGYGTAPGLVSLAQQLAFGSVNTGVGGKALTFTFSNSWNRPEQLTGFDVPGAPYSVSGLPRVGTVLAPGQSVTVSVAFDPDRAGSYPSRLRIATAHGSVVLPVTGSAATGVAHLAVSRATVDAGTVPVGHSVTVTFEVGDSGNIALIITRAIAPSGAFSATVPMPEGVGIDPGTFLHQTVTFRPTAVGPTSSRYEYNSNDGQGPVIVTLIGTGT